MTVHNLGINALVAALDEIANLVELQFTGRRKQVKRDIPSRDNKQRPIGPAVHHHVCNGVEWIAAK